MSRLVHHSRSGCRIRRYVFPGLVHQMHHFSTNQPGETTIEPGKPTIEPGDSTNEPSYEPTNPGPTNPLIQKTILPIAAAGPATGQTQK